MGCGSSSQVMPVAESTKDTNGKKTDAIENCNDHDRDDLSTVVLTDTPVKRPPIAFEIPLEDSMAPRTPPTHLHRLLQPSQPDVTSSDIQEKLAEAESRRQMILQQRAASARKRTQKMMRAMHDMNTVEPSESPEPIDNPGIPASRSPVTRNAVPQTPGPRMNPVPQTPGSRTNPVPQTPVPRTNPVPQTPGPVKSPDVINGSEVMKNSVTKDNQVPRNNAARRDSRVSNHMMPVKTPQNNNVENPKRPTTSTLTSTMPPERGVCEGKNI